MPQHKKTAAIPLSDPEWSAERSAGEAESRIKQAG